ncbi:ABC transporter ATP-binding protein [Arthrobacter sp. NPDC093128]|uniref:ABC transporter ATP-binding protein n=1 Tax=Arthrobacter sp. NPDC093128 TaxID=3154979 RepID=UPI00343E078B
MISTTTKSADSDVNHGTPVPEDASISGLEKTFTSKNRTVHALRGINLQIRKGEYVVVLGPSGCGKTTLIRCISGLEGPTGGSISLLNRTLFDATKGIDVRPNKRNVGLVFQNYALWPHMTVEKNVAYPLRVRRVPRQERERRVAEVLLALECEPLAQRLPAELSGGQQQRVALARALVSEPGILLLDEPLSNLDALLRISLRSELLRLHRKLGFTAIHITHDQDEALEMGDRVVLMREGQIEQMGPPEEVYARPVSPYAATFLGVRNNLDVTVTQGALTFRDGAIKGSEELATGLENGNALRLFVRNQDVRISALSGDAHFGAGVLSLEGTLAQVVLGAGGRREYIVDIAGKQWFAGGSATTELTIGDRVQVTFESGRALLYQGEALVNR